MPFDSFRFKTFTRRVFILGALQGLGFVLILFRLFKFQILDYKYFKDKSDNNRIKSIILPPLRGIIYDRSDNIVACNNKYYRLILKKTNYKEDLRMIYSLSKVLNFGNDGLNLLKKEYYKNKQFREVILYRYLNRKEILDVKFNKHLLKNIFFGVGYARIYSNSLSFSNLVGYVIQVPKSLENQHFSKNPDIKIGAEGLEKIYNDKLIGRAGIQYHEVNSKGETTSNLKFVKPINGENMKFSFDLKLQNFSYEICKNKKISVVLMDIKTGEVLVMLSTPSFNSNMLSQKIESSAWYDLINNPNKPLLNRPIQSAFTPGSLFKPITVLTALENDFSPDEVITCTGETKIHGIKRRCWLKRGHGKNINLSKAIKHSCNIMFYKIGEKYDVDLFHQTCKQLGLGEEFKNFAFQNQNTGINPSRSWKKKYIKEIWFPGDTVNLAIGQGFIRLTGLQFAVMMARIASLGKKVEPTLNFIEKPELVNFGDIKIKKENLQIVKNALFEASNSPGGTSYYSRIREKGLEFSGKTGTAQVVSKFLEKDEYTDNTRPHGLFAAFAPFDEPKFSISVISENGGFGASTAAPIGKKILYFAQLLDLKRINDAKKFTKSLGINFEKL